MHRGNNDILVYGCKMCDALYMSHLRESILLIRHIIQE